jgi:hypothetical protein
MTENTLFNGNIDQYIVYDHAFTSNEVSTLNAAFASMPRLDEYMPGLKFTVYNGYMNDDVNYPAKNSTNIRTNGNIRMVGLTTKIDNILSGTGGNIAPNGGQHTYTVEWVGFFKPDRTGNWYFSTNSDDCSFLWIGDSATSGYTIENAFVNNRGQHGMNGVFNNRAIRLDSDTYYPIRIQFGENWGGHDMVVSFKYENENYQVDGQNMYFSQAN